MCWGQGEAMQPCDGVILQCYGSRLACTGWLAAFAYLQLQACLVLVA